MRGRLIISRFAHDLGSEDLPAALTLIARVSDEEGSSAFGLYLRRLDALLRTDAAQHQGVTVSL